MAGRFKLVVSDLHLGAGFFSEGNTLEDFTSDLEFAALLEEAVRESSRKGAEVELIVNGDAFEMLQVPHVDSFDPKVAYPPSAYRSTSEQDSARKMALIVAGHPAFFAALSRFLCIGPPRRTVTFIRGNHDLDLPWPLVQQCIREAVGATGEKRELLAFEEWRVCRDGIYVEHGNQYAESLSRVGDMEEAEDPRHPGRLALPLGARLVVDVFNELERARYWVDGVKPVHALVCYALVYDFALAARAAASLLRSLPGVIADGLLVARDPRGDLVRQLEDPGRVEEIALRHSTDQTFRAWFNAELARFLQPLPSEEVAPGLSEVDLHDPLSLGLGFQRLVRSSLYAAARRRAAESGARLILFGHTHEPGAEALPGGAVYYNTGTWTWRGDFTLEGKRTWRELFEHPERYVRDRHLSFVRIDYGPEDQPEGRLLVWHARPTRISGLWGWLGRVWSVAHSLWQRLVRWFGRGSL